MFKKQRPRLDRFFSKIKTLLVVSPGTHVNARPVAAQNSVHVQMELDLWLKGRGE